MLEHTCFLRMVFPWSTYYILADTFVYLFATQNMNVSRFRTHSTQLNVAGQHSVSLRQQDGWRPS